MLLNTNKNSLPGYKDEIIKLKKEMNAVILAHYYQTGDIQDIADYIGDSLDLSRRAKATEASVIVFCGVHFMAETAKILNPDKLVLIPDMEAGCSLADSCPADRFSEFRRQHPEYLAVTYINCSAEVKAASDIICTSSNAEKIIRQIPADKPILFSPDRNLGAYLMKTTGRAMKLWDGACIVHEAFSENRLIDLKLEHPGAKVIAHPECQESILHHADYIGSTSKLLQFINQDPGLEFIVVTEPGIIHQMEKAAPEKKFIPAPPSDKTCNCSECPYMRLNTLEKLYNCMAKKSPQIELTGTLIEKALVPLERMLAMS
jgi:quinolinate synthase